MAATVTFDNVSKKFRKGERHDSLRDLVPATLNRVLRGAPPVEELSQREFWAVRNVSFDVEPGEALGIIGPNGAGKSTTLKLLTKILKPTSGHAHVRGRVGALIEVAAGFHPDLTGRENVFLQGAIMGMRRHEIEKHFDEIVEFAGVESFIDTPVKRYSSGMNARLGFSIAAHLRPDVLIIDEVLSVGDMAFQEKCYSRMETFLRRGVAIVLVSHNLPAVTQLCKRSLLLIGGTPSLLAPTAETLRAYSSAVMPVAQVGTAEDARIQVEFEQSFLQRSACIQPGERIGIKVAVDFNVSSTESVVVVAIWDLARNMIVYGASADSVGVPAIRCDAGDHHEFQFELTANLARGTYAVEVSLYDVPQQRRLGTVKPAAQFTVSENQTFNGMANLYLTGVHITTPLLDT